MAEANTQAANTLAAEWVNTAFDALSVEANNPVAREVFELRKTALKKFKLRGIPTTKEEEWKYTNLQELARVNFLRAPRASRLPTLSEIQALLLLKGETTRFVFVNGYFESALSEVQSSLGFSWASLASVLLGQEKAEIQELVANKLGKLASNDEFSFVALNSALSEEGLVLHIPRNSDVRTPVEILHLVTEDVAQHIVTPRVLIVAEEGSRVSIVEQFKGLSGAAYLTNVVCEVVVKPNAHVEHVRLQAENENAYHVSMLHIEQEQDSVFKTHACNLGGRLVRNEVVPVLSGKGIECKLNGLTVLNGSQHVDNHTSIDHAAPHCVSYEWYKGIYGDSSSGVFSGTIIVRPDAQKTNAYQSNDSLLLSDRATIDTKPQLKIWADDVKCSHGATVGQLNQEGLFYLRSRGIAEKDARAMLIQGFAEDVLEQIELEAARESIEAVLLAKLSLVLSSS